jgi:hypothetical protein
MPLEFFVGLSTFGFQFLASSARALLLLCGSSGFRAARLQSSKKSEYDDELQLSRMVRAMSHLADSFHARAGGNESGIAAGGTAAAT